MQQPPPPLDGLRVIELSHMVMGPSIGLILADLGATVVKIEPPRGDKTRALGGSGAGYFTMYNRNKESVCIDLKSERGRAVARRLITDADVLIENFREGTVDGLGLDYGSLSERNPRLIYCSARGFLPGPYAHRTALDEVAQMMGGLAYMTGLPGRPMRAGASVVDVMGGLFGVVAILAALEARQRSGRGQRVRSALFESTAFLVGQHMAQEAVLGVPPEPMSVRTSAWAIYDIFDSRDGMKVFVAVVSDSQWRTFCEAFDLGEIGDDPDLAGNAARVAARERILPAVRDVFARMDQDALMAALEGCGLPYAPIARPGDLFDDPHLRAAGGLLDVHTNTGTPTRLPALPVELDGRRMGLRKDVPQAGEDTQRVLREAGYGADEIEALRRDGVVR